MINSELKAYIENEIFPEYAHNDEAHDLNHIAMVIENSLYIAEHIHELPSADFDGKLDLNKVYTIAAYHDIGLRFGRKNHNITSAAFLLVDENLRKWFDEDEIMLMKEAVEDHRASIKHEPRSIYGKIVGDADRMQPCEVILERCMIYGKEKWPEMSLEEQTRRTLDHIEDKYAEGGYLKLWIVTPKIFTGLTELRETAKDWDKLLEICSKYY